MNSLLAHVFQQKGKNEQEKVDEVHRTNSREGKINLKQFAIIEEHMKSRVEKKASEKPLPKQEVVEEAVSGPKKLEDSRYAALSQLPTFWQNRKPIDEDLSLNVNQPISHRPQS